MIRITDYESAESFLFACEDNKALDVLLLDIQMDGMDGLTLARRIRLKNETVRIVFVTGYPDFMAEGYDVSALHYLMKPVHEGKLYEVLDKASTRLKKAEQTLLVQTQEETAKVPLDDILFSKISLAASKQVRIDAKAIVPKTLSISEIDLCIIIGNLLDNATEACMKLTNKAERFIRIYIDVLKEQLYISIANSVGGPIKKSGNAYLSTKGQDGHGFGLMRVDRIAEKYGGFINRQSEIGRQRH